MKKAIISAAIIAATFVTVPLAAQPSYGGRSQQGYDNRSWNGAEFWSGAPRGAWERIQFLQQRIDRGVRDGSLDRREYNRVQSDLNRIRRDAQQMRRGGFSRRENNLLDARLDRLARTLRFERNDNDVSRYRTDYDAQRYYRDGPQYSERRLSSQDEVYRGSDGRYYCKRSDGTTGLIIGGLAGGIFGNVVDGGNNRLAGTLIGGALGALAGREIDRNSDVRCR